jgi:hypothetical protein
MSLFLGMRPSKLQNNMHSKLQNKFGTKSGSKINLERKLSNGQEKITHFAKNEIVHLRYPCPAATLCT